MGRSSIPVDLFNPGQVFACLGFLEAADVLRGDAEGGFDWTHEGGTRFELSIAGEENPFEAVLEFLAHAELKRCGPLGYADPPPKKGSRNDEDEASGEENEADDGRPDLELAATFPDRTGDRMTLAVRIGGGNRPTVELGHWADGSSRQNFKLYSGNRSADRIARAMLAGTRNKPTKKQKAAGRTGDLKTKGLQQLWEIDREALVAEPLDVLTPMGGSFNFDPRGAWTAIDAGYSPNDQKHAVQASPVVEFLAAWGLEHARPRESEARMVRYAAWGISLSPALARAALGGTFNAAPSRRFRFELAVSGKNKVVTFAQEEPQV